MIQEDKDADYFRFKAKKGQRYYIKAMAAPLPHLWIPSSTSTTPRAVPRRQRRFERPRQSSNLHLPQGRGIPPPNQGSPRQGKPRHVYRIETHRILPEVSASIPLFRTRDTQSRQMLPIARGSQVATALNVSRKSFSGDLEILARNLPAGVTMEAPPVNGAFTSTPILLRAQGRPLGQSLVDLSLVHENAEKKVKVSGASSTTRPFVYGPPNNRTYYDTKLSRLAVAVVDPIPFKVKLHQPVNPIVRSGSQNIKVEIVRDANFTKAITVRILTRPPGIGAKSSISIAEGKSVGYYALTANGGSAWARENRRTSRNGSAEAVFGESLRLHRPEGRGTLFP